MGSGSQDLGDQLFLPPSVEWCGGHGVSCLAVRGPVHSHPHSRCAWLPLLRRPRDLEAGRPMRLGVLGQGREVPLEVEPLASQYWPLLAFPSPSCYPAHLFMSVQPLPTCLCPPYPASGATGLSTPRHLPCLASNPGPPRGDPQAHPSPRLEHGHPPWNRCPLHPALGLKPPAVVPSAGSVLPQAPASSLAFYHLFSSWHLEPSKYGSERVASP